MDRLAVVVSLKPDHADDARALVAKGPPFDPGELGLARHAIYVSSTEVVFEFEGPEVEWAVDDLVNDPAVSAAFSAWGPLIDGNPRLAHQEFFWSRENDGVAAGEDR